MLIYGPARFGAFAWSKQQSVCSWRALSFLCMGDRNGFPGREAFRTYVCRSFTLSCALLLTDCPPSSSHARLRLRPSWPWPCPFASLFLPARVLRVHPSRDAPRGEAVPGPAQEPVPYQGAEGHRPPPGKGFELDGWRGWHDGHGAGLPEIHLRIICISMLQRIAFSVKSIHTAGRPPGLQ